MGLGALHQLDAAIEKYKENLPPLLLWEPIPEITGDLNFQQKLGGILEKLDDLGVSYLFLKSEDTDEKWKEQISLFVKETKKTAFEILTWPSHQRILSEKISFFVNLITELGKAKTGINSQTIAYFKKVWCHNYLKNLSLLHEKTDSFHFLNQINFHNKTPVFVGASPTLESEIPHLKNLRDQIFIFSSDTSLQFLLASNILPDAVLSFDPGRGTLYHFLPEIPPTLPILSWLGGASYLFSLPNPLYLINTDFPLDQILEFKMKEKWPGLPNPSLNLVGMGKALAELGNAKELMLTGVSFISENGKSHCRGTGYETFRLPKIRRTEPWENICYSRMYAKREGKNQIAWDRIWAKSGTSLVRYLIEAERELMSPNHIPIDVSDAIFSGFKGFPELRKEDWERAFQQFPEAISLQVYERWHSL